ncbi:MAG TPA: carboxypeptidase regulatory-like domain-containing protein [Candidatus Limnocylindria bacterium]|nr:carboxypeptidase regulatory-like domain-containing protein [Candidatus Limnocylindria bacterium]
MKVINSLVCTFLIVLLAPCLAHAQGVGFSGDIGGAVTDPTGAVVPKANITAVETDRGIRHAGITDDRGQYHITGLSPASYDVTAQIAGFGTEIQKGVVVTVGATTIVDFHLKISTTKSTIEVSAQPPIVEVERGSQADTVVQQYISDLPISRRDYLTFTLLMPGVSDSTRLTDDQDFRVKQTPQSGLSFYGSNGRGNSVTLDGGENNDDSGGVRLTLSQDAVQEFQINRSNYAADLGGASGASINIVSKSGSNQLHGTLFGLVRNSAMDAQDPFAFTQAPVVPFTFTATGHPVKNSLSREQFGTSIGGPIQKDKTFFYGSFEGLYQDSQNAVPILTNTSIFAGPSPFAAANPFAASDPRFAQQAIVTALASNPSAVPVPCVNLPNGTFLSLPPQMCAGALATGLTVSPTTGLSPIQTGLNNFLIGDFEGNGGLFDYNTRTYIASVRLDHTFSDKNQVFLRYTYGHDLEESPDVQSLTGFTRGSSIHTYSNTIQGSWFHIFNPLMQNEARVQWNYTDFNVLPNQLGSVGLDIPGYGSFGNQIFIPSLTIMRRPDIADNFTKIIGHHTVKFGGEFLYRNNHTESHTFFPGRFVFGNLPGGALSPCLAPAISPATTNACGLTTTGASINALQTASLGVPQFYEQGFGNPIYNYPRPFTAFYVQDSWNMASNFTLNFGLRYELDSQYGPLSTDKDNFAPRVSFAWDPFKDHKTVVRGGFGIFYSPIYGQIADVVKTLGNINNTRQIANFLAPANINAPCALLSAPNPTFPLSGCIFQSLFVPAANASGTNLIACTKPAPGAAACITPADLAPLGIIVTNTGPLPLLTVLFTGQPNYQSPYSEQASFGIEREVAQGLSVSVSGIYSHTLRLPVAIDLNALPAPTTTLPLANGGQATFRNWNGTPSCPGGDPYPGTAIPSCFVHFGILQANQYSSQGSALYEGLIVEVKKRFSDHFTLMGNYTYSKAFDTTTDFNSDFGPQDNTNLGAERGLSDFDQRHKFVVAGVFDSPWKNPILAGFQLSPIVRYNSGHPFNLLAGADVNGDRHSTNDRPIGAARNTGLGPNYTTWDMRLSRTFKLGERINMQLLAEAFNILNRTNYASVNNVVSPTLGLPTALGGGGATTFNVHGQTCASVSQPLCFTSDYPKRQLQLGARFSF